jgi:hypothetical protein
MTDKELREVLRFINKHDLFDSLFWNEDVEFYFNCNDVFWWGTADCEKFTYSDLPDIEKAINETDAEDGVLLWVARKRKMRPQGAYYKHIIHKHHELFNACGEERELSFTNPKKHTDL